LRLGSFELEATRGAVGATGEVKVTIRPERVELDPHGTTGQNRLPGMVERLVYLGNSTQLIVRVANGDTVQALVQNRGVGVGVEQGTPVSIHFPADAIRVLGT